MIGRFSGAAILALWLGLAGVMAQVPADKIAADIAQRYGVTVLRVMPAPGGDTYAVTVMNPGGNDNGAFEVTTLIVEAASGALVPQFAHLASGYALPPPSDRGLPGDDSGPSIRSMTAREYRPR